MGQASRAADFAATDPEASLKKKNAAGRIAPAASIVAKLLRRA